MERPENYKFPQHKSRESSLYESSGYVHIKSSSESAYTLHVEIATNLYIHFTFYPERPAIELLPSDEKLVKEYDKVFCLICLRLMNTGEMMWMDDCQKS